MRCSLLLVFVVVCGCAVTPPATTTPATTQPRASASAQPPVDPLVQELTLVAVAEDGQVNGARCGLRNDKGAWEIVPPGTLKITRSAKPLEIVCVKSGFRVALQKSESGGDVITSAAKGAVLGGAVSALAAMPLLAIPIFGPAMYAGAVGGSALFGGTVNAAVDHSQGTVYAYPAALSVRMVRELSGGAVPQSPPAQVK